VKRFVTILLGLCLGLFLADAALSVLDDTIILCFGVSPLSSVRVLLFFFEL